MGLTGLIVTGFFFWFVVRRPLVHSVINPFFYICLLYLVFFGVVTWDSYAEIFSADLLTSMGFVIFSFSYFVFYRGFSKKSALRVMQIVYPLEKKISFQIRIFSHFFIIGYSAVFLIMVFYYGIIEYGDIQRYIVHFYTKGFGLTGDLHFLIKNFLKYGDLFLVVFLIFTRVSWIVRNDKSSKISFIWVLFCYYAVSVPSARRGLLVVPVIVVFLIDLMFFIRNKDKKINIFVPAVLSCISLTFIFLLTLSRGIYFDNFSDFATEIQDIVSDNRGSYRIDRFSGGIMSEVSFILKSYGESRDFLGFHTLHSILVNPVPRVFWPEKPVGFGLILAREKGYLEESNTSLAAGIAGEGYANYGILGAVFFSLIFGGVAGLAGKIAHVCFLFGNLFHIPLGILFFRLSVSFVRGDMLSAWGMSVYPIFLYIFLFFIFKKFFMRLKVS